MIRVTATINTAPIDDLIGFLDSQNQIVEDIGNQVFDHNAPTLLDELQYEPGAVKYPIQWASERQRKFVMAKLRREDNLPYQRTHELVEKFEVVRLNEAGQFLIVVRNNSPVAKYVVGSLAKDRTAAVRFIQQFHLNTGWQPAVDTVNYWLDAMREEFLELYAQVIGEFGTTGYKRRGYTR